MKKIVILGASCEGIKFIEEFRSMDAEASFSVFSFEESLPYNPSQLCGFLAGEVELDDVHYKPKEFYESHQIDIIFGKKIHRITSNRKRVTTDEKEVFNYDYLVITDTKDKQFPDIKGTNKEGVFALNRLDDIQTIIKNAAFFETVVVQIKDMRDRAFAVAIKARKKDVLLSCGPLTPEEAQDLTEWAQAKDIRLLTDDVIEEILGDREMKAVRLKSGKVIAAQAIGYTHLGYDFRTVRDLALNIHTGIVVDQSFKTNIGHVFAIGDIVQLGGESSQSAALEGVLSPGQRLARYMLGKTDPETSAVEQSAVSVTSSDAESYEKPFVQD